MLKPCSDESCGWIQGETSYLTSDDTGGWLQMTGRRWYPTVAGLEDGSLIVIGGDQSPVDAPFLQRSLPPSNLDWPDADLRVPYDYHIYEVLQPFNVSAGPIAPWFEQPGQGVQYHMSSNISTLLGQNYLRNVNDHKLLDSKNQD